MSARCSFIAASLLCCLLVVIACGCKQDDPPAQKPSSVEPPPDAPRPAAPGPDDGDENSIADNTVSNKDNVEALDPSRDDRDDPSTPNFFPPSNVISQFVKHEPVRVMRPDELGSVLTASEAARIGHFQVRSAAQCAYAMHAVGGTAVARVVAIETDDPADAYGIYTCATDALQTLPVGGATRVDRTGGLEFHTWQGRQYLRVVCDASTPDVERAVVRLLQYMTARILREDVPPLIQALPSDAARPGERWLVRHLASLSPSALERAASPEVDTVSRVLGLDGSAVMCIAAYDVPDARRSNVIWLVQYPDAESATSAHERYQQYLAGAAVRSARSTTMLEPRGRYLVGTWTAEEESLQYMMPRVAEMLPS